MNKSEIEEYWKHKEHKPQPEKQEGKPNPLKRNLIIVSIILCIFLMLFFVLTLFGYYELASRVGFRILAPTPLWLFIATLAAILEDM